MICRTLVLIVLLASPTFVSAQGTTGSISGFVTSDTAGALPGATVTVRNVETAQRRVIEGEGAGGYRARQLAPVPYEFTVELSGFAAPARRRSRSRSVRTPSST